MSKSILLGVIFFVIGFSSCALILASANMPGDKSVVAVWNAASVTVKSVLLGAKPTDGNLQSEQDNISLSEVPPTTAADTNSTPVVTKPQQRIKEVVPLDEASIREIEQVHLDGSLASPGEYSSGPPAEDIAFHQQLKNLKSPQEVKEENKRPPNPEGLELNRGSLD